MKSIKANLRRVRVESTRGSSGQTVTVNLLVNAAGDESEYGFIFDYDQDILSNPVIKAGNAGASVRSCNKSASGRTICSVGGFAGIVAGIGVETVSSTCYAQFRTSKFCRRNRVGKSFVEKKKD